MHGVVLGAGCTRAAFLRELFREGAEAGDRAAHIEFVGRALMPALLPECTATEQWSEACAQEATSASGVDTWLRIEREKAGYIPDLEDDAAPG